jgi:plasmid stability protein
MRTACNASIAVNACMEVLVASLTIRQIDDDLKTQLRLRAAANNNSMEEEARRILRSALTPPVPEHGDFVTRIRRMVDAAGGGFDLELPPRGPERPLPDVFEK